MISTYRISCDRCTPAGINGIPSHETGCTGHFTYTDSRKRRFHRFRVWSLDVWGNARDGYEVNDRSSLGHCLIPEDASDRDLIRALKGKGWIRRGTRFQSFDVEGDDSVVHLDCHGVPLFTLERD